MSSKATADFISTEANFSPTSSSSRSKKLPPPPLCLPATTASTEDEKTAAAAQRRERKKSANQCCLPTSSDECPHPSAPYTLPVSQRPQILKTLIASSSSLLMPPPSENKYKRLYNAAYTNQLNLLKQLQPSAKATVNDNEWIDLMRFIVHKPLEDELKSLLDKYKMTYFDQVNAPNASDETIRSSLCAIVTEALAAYSASSAPPPASSSITTSTSDDTDTNVASPLIATASVNNGSAKRKRKLPGVNPSNSAATALNNQTKFVISYIIPGKHEHHSGHKSVNQQQLKQFQKKCSHLFKYVPDKDEYAFLQRQDLVKSSSSSSTASRSPTNRQICLMLHEEVVDSLDEYDLAFSGISLDNSFALPDSFLARIASMSQ